MECTRPMNRSVKPFLLLEELFFFFLAMGLSSLSGNIFSRVLSLGHHSDKGLYEELSLHVERGRR